MYVFGLFLGQFKPTSFVEGGSLNVVNALKKLNRVGGSRLMEDCRYILRKEVRSRVSHVFWEANGSADWLANRGRIVEETRIWHANFPDDLLDIMQRDASGCIYYKS